MLMLIGNITEYSPSFRHFNTSHVNVNQLIVRSKCIPYSNFNTSHVNVNQLFSQSSAYQKNNFNTSHVNVNPAQQLLQVNQSQISIHLMLMLIAVLNQTRYTLIHFNTSHVNVNHGTLDWDIIKEQIFQYISC